ncbi:MAG TPA: GNAT family N-acetyltransferase [Anaerolineae bacterium]|nr:GNAT family N-acetyltransferase [Anaerolineae bacterium]
MKSFIRKSERTDAMQAVKLLLMTMGDFGICLLGFGNKHKTQSVARQFFLYDGNRFSFRFADILLVDSNIAGLLLSFPGEAMIKLEMYTFFQLWRVYKKMEAFKFIWRILPLVNYKEAEKDEYYIAHLAVNPSYRRRGIGKQLLEHAEVKAKERGMHKCSLSVDVDNTAAIKLYSKCGYEIVSKYNRANLMDRFNTRGKYRMVKCLKF